MHPICHIKDFPSGYSFLFGICSRRLAAVTLSRIVSLFDENGEVKDKFSTKPADPKQGSRFYTITGMVFSPDSTRLAIAQSDEIIYVYKLGAEWGDKKTICNKLQQMASITAMVWPCIHQHEIWFGLTDGKVKVLGHLMLQTVHFVGHVTNYCA
ncbi:hypothetical protein R1sor_017756 [Riccia sorocarpa]|uniref:Uncharacterized protein n=1 Tax=Riccia sorocarpa TaxID=122646 RepID=A0ABD3IB08_9MARC